MAAPRRARARALPLSSDMASSRTTSASFQVQVPGLERWSPIRNRSTSRTAPRTTASRNAQTAVRFHNIEVMPLRSSRPSSNPTRMR